MQSNPQDIRRHYTACRQNLAQDLSRIASRLTCAGPDERGAIHQARRALLEAELALLDAEAAATNCPSVAIPREHLSQELRA